MSRAAGAATGAPDQTSASQPRLVPRLAAAGCLLALLVLVGFVFFSGSSKHHYKLLFQNAGQLVPDNQVQIGGLPVGSVDAITLTDSGLAQVEISLDQQLHQGTSAVIRATSLAGIANRYVSVSPGPDNAPALAEGAVVGTEHTTTPVDLDQVFNAFTPKTRKGLTDFIKGQADVYVGKGQEANQSYRYLYPALSQTNRFVSEINRDQQLFESFITQSAKVFNTLALKHDDLASSVANANGAFSAIASQNEALSQTLEQIPDTFRQSNTAFVNLRAALGDLDALVNTAKPATVDLASFLRQSQPVLKESLPFFDNFATALSRPGKANDLGDLTSLLPSVEDSADPAFSQASRAIADFQPTLNMARAYAPEMLNSLAKLGQITAYYDADGHYARTALADLNIFAYDAGSGLLSPAPADDQFDPYGSQRIDKRCPGGASQPAADGSSPFYDPPWSESGLVAGKCDPKQVPAGP